VITLQDLYLFDFAAGLDASGRHTGTLKSTGLRPQFAQTLIDRGIEVPVPAVAMDRR